MLALVYFFCNFVGTWVARALDHQGSEHEKKSYLLSREIYMYLSTVVGRTEIAEDPLDGMGWDGMECNLIRWDGMLVYHRYPQYLVRLSWKFAGIPGWRRHWGYVFRPTRTRAWASWSRMEQTRWPLGHLTPALNKANKTLTLISDPIWTLLSTNMLVLRIWR